MFPPVDPFASGMLSVDENTEIYWETSGHPEGKPAVHLHSGPGGGMRGGYRRRYDPDRYFIVGFEQRGCGLPSRRPEPSTPCVSAPGRQPRRVNPAESSRAGPGRRP